MWLPSASLESDANPPKGILPRLSTAGRSPTLSYRAVRKVSTTLTCPPPPAQRPPSHENRGGGPDCAAIPLATGWCRRSAGWPYGIGAVHDLCRFYQVQRAAHQEALNRKLLSTVAGARPATR